MAKQEEAGITGADVASRYNLHFDRFTATSVFPGLRLKQTPFVKKDWRQSRTRNIPVVEPACCDGFMDLTLQSSHELDLHTPGGGWWWW